MAFRNASGWLVVSGSMRKVRGEKVVNLWIAMSLDSVFESRGQWHVRMENLLMMPTSST